MHKVSRKSGDSLWWWVEHKLDSLLNIALQACLASFQEFLLVFVYLAEDVVSFLCARRLSSCQYWLASSHSSRKDIRQAR